MTTLRLSGLDIESSLPATIRLSGIDVEAVPVAIPDAGMWVYVGEQWRPIDTWINVP